MRDFNKQKQPVKLEDKHFWRYKKKTAPVDEFADLNGPVIIRKQKTKFVALQGNYRYILYLLELEEGKYYVGVTTQTPERRLEQHIDGTMGAKWTRKYKPVCIKLTRDLGIIDYDAAQTKEDKAVIEFIGVYGLDNVRGGAFCRITPTKDPIGKLNRHIYKIYMAKQKNNKKEMGNK